MARGRQRCRRGRPAHGSSGSSGRAQREFQSIFAGGIDVDAAGNVYVANPGTYRIQKLTSNGRFVAQWGATCHGDMELDHPSGVAVGPAGDVSNSEGKQREAVWSPTVGTFLA